MYAWLDIILLWNSCAFLELYFFPKRIGYNEHYDKSIRINFCSTDFFCSTLLRQNTQHRTYTSVSLSLIFLLNIFGRKRPLSVSTRNKFDTYKRIRLCVSCNFEMRHLNTGKNVYIYQLCNKHINTKWIWWENVNLVFVFKFTRKGHLKQLFQFHFY